MYKKFAVKKKKFQDDTFRICLCQNIQDSAITKPYLTKTKWRNETYLKQKIKTKNKYLLNRLIITSIVKVYNNIENITNAFK